MDTILRAPGAPLIANVPEKTLRANVEAVLSALERNRYRDEPPAQLVAVTKTVAPDVINALLPLGVRDIGENRAQVALPKLPMISPDFRLHWIGRLQSNKVKGIIDQVCLLHSLDSLSLAQEIERRAGMRGLTLPALVQVNIAREPQKAGVDVTELRNFLRKMKGFSSIRVEGLMAMMPLDADAERLTEWFRAMRTEFDRLHDEAIEGIRMDTLSMGMSNDYQIAAREGATMVRVGTALFRT